MKVQPPRVGLLPPTSTLPCCWPYLPLLLLLPSFLWHTLREKCCCEKSTEGSAKWCRGNRVLLFQVRQEIWHLPGQRLKPGNLIKRRRIIKFCGFSRGFICCCFELGVIAVSRNPCSWVYGRVLCLLEGLAASSLCPGLGMKWRRCHGSSWPFLLPWEAALPSESLAEPVPGSGWALLKVQSSWALGHSLLCAWPLPVPRSLPWCCSDNPLLQQDKTPLALPWLGVCSLPQSPAEAIKLFSVLHSTSTLLITLGLNNYLLQMFIWGENKASSLVGFFCASFSPLLSVVPCA